MRIEILFYLHAEFNKGILIGGGDVSPKLNLKQCPLATEFYFQYQFPHVVFLGNLGHLYMYDHTKVQPNDAQTGDCTH